MRICFVASLLLGLALVTSSGLAQTHPLRDAEPSSGTAEEPDQPVQPQTPVLVPRAPQQDAQPPVVKPPFTLTQEEQAQVDHVLALWEKRNRAIQTFDCNFTRWIYDMVFNPPRPNGQPEPKYIDTGMIRFAAPDKGVFRVEKTQKNGAMVPIEDARCEHWICDGKSIFELNPTKKQLVEHQLPPEMQGKAIANSPLPFLFGAEAQKLKERYYIRIVTPADVKDQVWLEAYPRQRQADFHRAQFIIAAHGMAPFALKIFQLNRRDYIVYQFQDIVLNDPFRLFKGDPFRPYTPIGWTKVVQPPQSAQASRVPGTR